MVHVDYSGYSQYELHLTLALVDQNVAGNTSRVRRRGWTTKTDGTGRYTGETSGNRWEVSGVGPDKEVSGFTWDFRGATPKTILWFDDIVTIAHRADGTATVNAVLDSTMRMLGSATVRASLTLPRIPRGPMVKHNGAQRRTLAYVKTGGVYRVALAYIKSGGVYRLAAG